MVVLVAEDNEQIRSLLLKLLNVEGFTVLSACDGETALEASRNYAGPIDLLISDVKMPRMNGLELCGIVAQERPDTKALMMSGYPEVSGQTAGIGLPLLPKPFTVKMLRNAIESLLGPYATVEREAPETPSAGVQPPPVQANQDLVHRWLIRVRKARQEYDTARERHNDLLLRHQIQPLPEPDGSTAITNARLEESAAMNEYLRVLRVYTDIVTKGTVPDEEC